MCSSTEAAIVVLTVVPYIVVVPYTATSYFIVSWGPARSNKSPESSNRIETSGIASFLFPSPIELHIVYASTAIRARSLKATKKMSFDLVSMSSDDFQITHIKPSPDPEEREIDAEHDWEESIGPRS